MKGEGTGELSPVGEMAERKVATENSRERMQGSAKANGVGCLFRHRGEREVCRGAGRTRSSDRSHIAELDQNRLAMLAMLALLAL